MSDKRTVFIATTGMFEDYDIRGVFSTREAAEAYLKDHGGEVYGDLGCPDSIIEWEVDGPYVRTQMVRPGLGEYG